MIPSSAPTSRNRAMVPAFHRLVAIVACVLLCLSVKEASAAAKNKSKKKKKPIYDTSRYVNLCRGYPTLSKKHDHRALQWLLQTSGELSIVTEGTHQHRAACWMLHQDPTRSKHSPGSKQFAQRYALVVLWFATQGATKWGQKTNWLTKSSVCDWYGILCGDYGSQTVVGIDLGFNDLDGLLPRELALLNQVVEVDFHGNDLQGVLPHMVLMAWTKCEILRLHMNGFFGSIHTEIGYMTNMRELHLFGNYFGGTLPSELEKLKRLEVLDVYANALEGTIPSQLGRLRNLRELDFHDTYLVGTMPAEICNLKLKFLVSDCYGRRPEVTCSCCTICCEGLPKMRCVDAKTNQEVIVGISGEDARKIAESNAANQMKKQAKRKT